MEFTVIRYGVKEGRESENRALVEKVFEDLERNRPSDLRYLVLDLKDGDFLHIVTASDGKDTTSLTETAAFKAFVADHAERRSGPVVQSTATIVGSYRMLSKIG